MVSSVRTHAFQQAILDALGLKDHLVKRLTIEMDNSSVNVRIEEYPTVDQAEAISKVFAMTAWQEQSQEVESGG